MEVINPEVRIIKNSSIVSDIYNTNKTLIFLKYEIPLGIEIPSKDENFVKVIKKEEFEKLDKIIRDLKNESDSLENEKSKLKSSIQSQQEKSGPLEILKEKGGKEFESS